MAPSVLVAMSGGVDSSAAAALLLEQGFRCAGVTLKLCGEEADDARESARKLNIPHTVLDFTVPFRDDVILRFIKAYESGLTPNPCVECNRLIKFGRLLSELPSFRCDFLATGHYARIEKSGGQYLLKKAADRKKDQSYVLYNLSQTILARVIFPLGNLSKDEAREIAEKRALANAGKKESQDICFVPDGDYGAFMEAYTGRRYPEGDILDLEGRIIGRHKGHVRYTLGQRRGLGVAVNRPFYVCAKDAARNIVTMGPEDALYTKTLTARKINLVAEENLEKPTRVKVKTRYLEAEKAAWIQRTGPDEIRVDFDEPQRAVTPGQSAVFYDGDYVVGGGIIHATAM